MKKPVCWFLALPLALLGITACENAGNAPVESERETPTITVFDADAPTARVELQGTPGRGEVYRVFEMNADGERVEMGTLDPNNPFDVFGTDGPRLRELARSPELLAEITRLQEEGLSGVELLARLQKELETNPSLEKVRDGIQEVQVRK